MSDPLFDLTGRVALVTGSSQGLGKATARVLAQRGAHVIISSRKQEACDAVAAEFRDDGLSAEGYACNIGHAEDIDAIYTHIESNCGRLDILVNNAVLSPWRMIAETDRSLVMKALETNIAGYWFMSAGAVNLMKSRGAGSIINLSTVGTLRPEPGLALYTTFKSSLDGMTRSFAAEYGEFGIRVNTILPGVFKTPLADGLPAELIEKIKTNTPLGRLGDPAEIGHAVLFLASDASAYVTGTSLIVDGGTAISA
jgi:NAD(P)-dependent dehydrogenase (short-subunit alcohol dehydrogenase family)